MLRIFYENLGLYNEGIISGEWIDLPVSDEELEAVRNRTGYDETHEEYFIADFETDADGLTVGEYDDIDELNELAELIDEDPDIVSALLYHGYYTAEEIRDKKDDVLVIDNSNTMTLEEAVGYYYAELNGIENQLGGLSYYFDYEKYGRDIVLEGSFYEAQDGTIYEVLR